MVFNILAPPGVGDNQAQVQAMQDANRKAQQNAALDQFERETSSAREAMEFEAGQAALNRDFQREMSNTAYQRAVKDLEAAGLNRILAYSQGGASSPAGSTASGYKASATKADVDIDTLIEYLKARIDAKAKTSAAETAADAQVESAWINAISDVASSGLRLLG